MFSNKDFEKLWFLYRSEGKPKNIFIETFCSKNGIPYAQFNTWVQEYAQVYNCGYFLLLEIVKNKFHRDPYNGDVFISNHTPI